MLSGAEVSRTDDNFQFFFGGIRLKLWRLNNEGVEVGISVIVILPQDSSIYERRNKLTSKDNFNRNFYEPAGNNGREQ